MVLARFRDVRPQVAAACASAGEVAEAIALARRSGLELAVRSGGHCFAGRSSTTGVLIDVGPMRTVEVQDGLVAVGAGTLLCDLYDALAPHGRTVAAGCGPDVGIAGLTLGGGLGILGRTHGLTSDQLVAAEVVLADGRVVDCDEHTHPDLFWALRGAGGGQLGVVTRLVLRTVPAPETTTLHLVWPHADGAALLEAWQRWSPDAPDAMAASLLVTVGADPSEPPRVHVFGAMLAGEAETRAQLRALSDRAGAEPRSTELRTRGYRQAKAHLSDHGPGDEPSPDAHGWSKSEFFREPVPGPAVAALLAHVAADRAPGQLRVLDLSPWAGAYNRVAHDATAFPHRAERFLIKHDVVVDPPPDAAARERALRWLRRSWALVHPFGTGGVYPNFPDPELEDAERAYHGANLARLGEVKAAYDPDDVFRFPQSIAPVAGVA